MQWPSAQVNSNCFHFFFSIKHLLNNVNSTPTLVLLQAAFSGKPKSTISRHALVNTSSGIEKTNAGSPADFNSEAINKIIKGQSSLMISLKLR